MVVVVYRWWWWLYITKGRVWWLYIGCGGKQRQGVVGKGVVLNVMER